MSSKQVVRIIMVLDRIIICSILYFVATKAESNSIQTEDLVDEYYTTTTAITDKFTPQDEIDAQDIWDSDRKEDVIASILMYRDKTRRYAITQKILDKITGYRRKRRRWIVTTHYPQKRLNSTSTFRDLCFGLIYDENVVLGNYLANFFNKKDETWINIGMVLTKDMQVMITTYDQAHSDSIKDLRKDQRHPFENMLRVWVRHNREPIEKEKLNPDTIKQDANVLKAEQDDCGWHENRDQIELILMKKSVSYARAVLKEFETANGGTAIEKILIENIDKYKLNHDLADTYATLARYIKDKYKYIADILGKYCDGTDEWAAWIMCIAVVHPQEWSKVDEVFKKDHNGDSLSTFIMQKLTTDKVMAEMIALTVDSKFKPTTFTKKPEQNDPAKPPGTLPSLPPVPPTIPAPPPATPPP